MLTLFFDSEGLVHAEFMSKEITINAASYCNTLRLRKAIRDQLHSKLSPKELCCCMTMQLRIDHV